MTIARKTLLTTALLTFVVGAWHGPIPPPDEDAPPAIQAVYHGPIPPPDEDAPPFVTAA